MYLAEFNFIGLFDNLGWCWGFACVAYIKVKTPQKSAVMMQQVSEIKFILTR